MFNQYPYLNLNDLNLDYLLRAIRLLEKKMSEFIALNSIKYADPIEWNITRTYEINTVVVDPSTGDGYLSVQPVPAGVALNNEDYWTKIFDVSEIFPEKGYFIHVKGYGAKGDGVTNDTQAFIDAIAASPEIGYIFATNGDYIIDPDIDLAGNVLIISNATLSNPIKGKTIYIDNGNVFANYQPSVISAANWQDNPALKVGGQIMDVGLQIGTANKDQGTSVGTNIYADGHSNYMAFKPSAQLNPVELNLYASEFTGEVDLTAGSDVVILNRTNWNPGDFYDDLVGLPIHIEGYNTLRISELMSTSSVRVENYDGSPVSFTTGTNSFSIVITTYEGTIDVNGSQVTRKSGSPFLGYLANPHSLIRFNGNVYKINSVTDSDHLIISGSGGVLNDIPYKAYGDIEGESTAFRMNMGAGEQLTIQVNKQDNCFYIKTDGGVLHKWRDIIIQSSNHPNGIVLHADSGKISFNSTFVPEFATGYIYQDFATEKLGTKGTGIINWNYATDDGPIDINFRGENYTTDYFRDFRIYNGKEGLMLLADGSANEIVFTATPRPNTPNYVNVGDPTNTFKNLYAGGGFRYKPTYGLVNDTHKLGLDFITNLTTHTYEYDGKEKQGIDPADFWNALVNHGGDADCTVLQDNTIENFEMIVSLVNAITSLNSRVESGKTLTSTSGSGTNASKLATLKAVFDTLTDDQKERCYIVQNGSHIYHIERRSGVFRSGDPATNQIGFLTIDLPNSVFKIEYWGTGGYATADYSSATTSNFVLKML